MSQKVDHRVVEMRFDNKQFEAGAKETMGTLGKLKEALKLPETGKALEGIDKATKGIKLDGIASGVEALERRFSALGIVGMRVIENVTDGLMNKLHGAVSFVTDAIVSGGVKRAMNIENAHFQLQALLKDETKVQAVMADAMESVDGTAYAYDEAAKAASQFAASGIQAGDEMLGALKGITGVAAMTNSSFEDISRIFTTVAGNGRLMGDQLLQLSSRGLNAASTLADYFKEVRGQSGMTEASIREMVSSGQISFKDFSEAMTWAFGDSAKRANETFTGALSNMKSALARIGAGFISPLVEQNGELVQLFNALRVKINDVKSELVFDEQRSAITGLAEATKMSKDELSEMFQTIKTNGAVSTSDLDTLTKKGANAYGALTKYVNGVTEGSIRASYAITSALSELTNGTKVSTKDIKKFVEEGKIDLSTFTSAMETEFGNEKKLSNQFTDWFLDHVHGIVEAINAADMSKPMEIFYHWVESIKNIVKGLLSVIRPIGKAFSDVFLAFNIDDVNNFSDAVEKLTAKMRLSEKGSKNLHDAFQGLFSVIKLVVDVFFDLFGAIIPINRPIVEIGDGFLGLIGLFGRGLTSFTEMIRSCKLLRLALSGLGYGFSVIMNGITGLIKISKGFISNISEMEATTRLIETIISAFEKLKIKAEPYIKDFINETGSLFKSILHLKDIDLNDILDKVSKAFSELALEIEYFSFQTVEDAFESLRRKVQSLIDLALLNEGLSTFVTNFKQYGEELKNAFTLDNLLDRLERVMSVFGKFFKWVKETMAPAFEDFNIGSVVAAGGGLGIIYAMIKAAKAFERVSKAISSVPNLLNGVKGTLVAYQRELKAEALIKTAGAIAILAGALVLLSFADTDRLMAASIALTLIAGTLMIGIGMLMEALNKGRELNNALTIFSKGLSSTMKKFGRAVEIKAIGSAIKNFAESIAIIAVSIIALGVMYNKDSDSFMAGVELVKKIGIALVGIMAGMTILEGLLKGGMAGFSKAALGILFLSSSLVLCIKALNKLFKMEFPSDWEFRVKILVGMLVGLAALALALGGASKLAGGNKLSSAMILSMAALLVTTVLALNKLFKMEFPSDWEQRFGVLVLIFVGFGALMVSIGIASRLAGGTIKSAGTILSMCLFIATIVAALVILTLIPVEKMLYGATALGIILTTLGVALYGAGKITKKNTYKTVLAMAITVGAITASLGILSMVPLEKLASSAVALGSILLILAANFQALSKAKSYKKTLPLILGMIAASVTIAYELYILSKQPWKNLAAAGTALGLTLLALAVSFEMINKSKMSGTIKPKLKLLAELIIATGVVATEMYFLAQQPWQGLLAAGTALGLTLLALAVSFEMINKSKMSGTIKNKMMLLAELIAATIPIAIELYILAEQPWENLLAACISLGGTLLALSTAFAILSVVKVNKTALASVVAGSASLLLIASSIAILAQFDGSQLLNSCLALSGMLAVMIVVMAACGLLGGMVGPAMAGVLGLGLVIAELGLILAAIGGLAQIPGLTWLIGEGGALLQNIGKAIGDFIGGIVGGVMNGASSNLPQLGSALSEFMTNLQTFIEGSKNIDAAAVASVGFLSAIIVALTAAEVINGIANLFGLSLVDVADELSSFMIALRPFILQSKQLKEDTTRACGYLADMILTITKAEILSGIANFLGIGGSLAGFGEELSKFGPYIKQFADDVQYVKPESVEGAAAAAEIMANVAKNLPGTGGYLQKVFGEKSLSEFGAELVLFGPYIKQFADDVQYVKPESVEGAAAAAEIMANVAKNLPAQNGWLQKVFGERSLAEFGVELSKFGPYIAKFAKKVKNIEPESVEGAAAAAEIMAELANKLPDSDSLWSKIFGGGKMSLSEFGTELVKFGKLMGEFSSSLSDVKNEKISGVIENFKGLVDLTNYAKGASAINLIDFLNQFSQVGTDSINNFIEAFRSAPPKTTKVISDLCLVVINQFKKELPNDVFHDLGEDLVLWISDGMDSKKSTIQSSVDQNCIIIIKSFKDNLSESVFKEIGVNAAIGLKKGIESKINEVADAATMTAQKAVESTKKALDERSPSHILYKIGEFYSIGFANGIINKIRAIVLAGTKVADEAIKPVEQAVYGISSIIDSGDFDIDPVIKPVIDLTDIQRGAKEINSLMDQTYDLSSAYEKAMDVSSILNRNRRSTNDIKTTNPKSNETGNTFEFNQYNYSPKALSRSEIYRQTNNQFSAFQRAVKPT